MKFSIKKKRTVSLVLAILLLFGSLGCAFADSELTDYSTPTTKAVLDAFAENDIHFEDTALSRAVLVILLGLDLPTEKEQKQFIEVMGNSPDCFVGVGKTSDSRTIYLATVSDDNYLIQFMYSVTYGENYNFGFGSYFIDSCTLSGQLAARAVSEKMTDNIYDVTESDLKEAISFLSDALSN